MNFGIKINFKINLDIRARKLFKDRLTAWLNREYERRDYAGYPGVYLTDSNGVVIKVTLFSSEPFEELLLFNKLVMEFALDKFDNSSFIDSITFEYE